MTAASPIQTRVLAVLGGVASGKSVAARALAGGDGVVLDADRLAQAVLASPEVAARVAETFGADLLGPDGAPDRARLGERVFGDPEALSTLESWIHPRVRAMILDRLAEARAAGRPIVVLDVPLLLETDAAAPPEEATPPEADATPGSSLLRECDALVFVDAPAELRARRAAEHRGWDPGDVARRERHQLDLDEKRRRADHVLDNSGSRAALEAAAAELRNRLLTDPQDTGPIETGPPAPPPPTPDA